MEEFKKKERGYHETVVLEGESQVIVMWNHNAPVTKISNVLGTTPVSTCSRYSRKELKYMDILQPDFVQQYNQRWEVWTGWTRTSTTSESRLEGRSGIMYSIVTWLLDTAVQNACCGCPVQHPQAVCL
jgi:hypothetical protein